MTPAFPSKESARWAWHDNIAANSASGTIAKLRCYRRLPITTRVCQNESAAGRKRQRKAGVPEQVVFQTKPEIALEHVEAACKAGLPRGVALVDGYGSNLQHMRSWRPLARARFCNGPLICRHFHVTPAP
jgi:SRSO17 transposase